MGRKVVAVSQDAIVRAINAVKKAGIEVRTVRVEPDGAVVINGENVSDAQKPLAKNMKEYL